MYGNALQLSPDYSLLKTWKHHYNTLTSILKRKEYTNMMLECIGHGSQLLPHAWNREQSELKEAKRGL